MFYEIQKTIKGIVVIAIVNKKKSTYKSKRFYFHCYDDVNDLINLNPKIKHIEIKNTIIINIINHNMHLQLKETLNKLIIEDINKINNNELLV